MFKIISSIKHLSFISFAVLYGIVEAQAQSNTPPKWGHIKARDSVVFSFPNNTSDVVRKAIKIDSLGNITDSAGVNITWLDSLKAHNRGVGIQKNKIYVIDTLTNPITSTGQRNRIFMDTIDAKKIYINGVEGGAGKTFNKDIIINPAGANQSSDPSGIVYAGDWIKDLQGNASIVSFRLTGLPTLLIDTAGLPRTGVGLTQVKINKTSATTTSSLQRGFYGYPMLNFSNKVLPITSCGGLTIDQLDTAYFWVGGYQTFLHNSFKPTSGLLPFTVPASCTVAIASTDGARSYSFDNFVSGTGRLDTVVARWPFNTTSSTALPTAAPTGASAPFTTSNILPLRTNVNYYARSTAEKLTNVVIPAEQNKSIYKNIRPSEQCK